MKNRAWKNRKHITNLSEPRAMSHVSVPVAVPVPDHVSRMHPTQQPVDIFTYISLYLPCPGPRHGTPHAAGSWFLLLPLPLPLLLFARLGLSRVQFLRVAFWLAELLFSLCVARRAAAVAMGGCAAGCLAPSESDCSALHVAAQCIQFEVLCVRLLSS